jgi:dTDP-glucose pyrophosphorylase
MNILIPMAGRGSRFLEHYKLPKPLIKINGKPMIQLVYENIGITKARYIFLVLREHYYEYNLEYELRSFAPSCKIIVVDSITEGAACTSLLAEDHINYNIPLLIANSDQLIEWNSAETIKLFSQYDGGILTFKDTNPKWSFAKVSGELVEQVAEKNPISDDATVGIYYWKSGADYVKYAHQMIQKNIRTNGEFYICPVYNEAIQDGKRITIQQVSKMQGLGTPEDLRSYLDNNISQR